MRVWQKRIDFKKGNNQKQSMTIFFQNKEVQISWFKRPPIASLMVGMKNDTVTLKKRMTESSKVKHPSTCRYLSKRKRNICLHKMVCKCSWQLYSK